MLQRISLAAAMLAGIVGIAHVGTSRTAQAQDNNVQVTTGQGVRVGVYDSRAVAVAYFASDLFREQMAPLREEYDAAKAAGNDERVKEIDARMQARQAVAHRQGFGTAPVDDILSHIKDGLPEVAKSAGVDVIVSKWAINYSAADASLIDITDEMVAPFNPDERTLKIIADLRTKAPVPLKDLENMSGH